MIYKQGLKIEVPSWAELLRQPSTRQLDMRPQKLIIVGEGQ